MEREQEPPAEAEGRSSGGVAIHHHVAVTVRHGAVPVAPLADACRVFLPSLPADDTLKPVEIAVETPNRLDLGSLHVGHIESVDEVHVVGCIKVQSSQIDSPVGQLQTSKRDDSGKALLCQSELSGTRCCAKPSYPWRQLGTFNVSIRSTCDGIGTDVGEVTVDLTFEYLRNEGIFTQLTTPELDCLSSHLELCHAQTFLARSHRPGAHRPSSR